MSLFAELVRSRRTRALAAAGLVTGLLAGATTAAASEPESVSFDALLPNELHYSRWSQGQKPRSVRLLRSESLAVEAPTRYRTESVLRYTKPLGQSGMFLRVKAPLKPTKLIKLELHF